jgi:hypothetical protein
MIAEEVHRVRKPFATVVNDAIRRGLAPRPSRRSTRRYRVRPHVATLLPGPDRGKLNALADHLEDGTLLAKPWKRPAR